MFAIVHTAGSNAALPYYHDRCGHGSGLCLPCLTLRCRPCLLEDDPVRCCLSTWRRGTWARLRPNRAHSTATSSSSSSSEARQLSRRAPCTRSLSFHHVRWDAGPPECLQPYVATRPWCPRPTVGRRTERTVVLVVPFSTTSNASWSAVAQLWRHSCVLFVLVLRVRPDAWAAFHASPWRSRG